MMRPLGKKWVVCPCGVIFKRDSRRYKYCCVECRIHFQHTAQIERQRKIITASEE